MLKQSVPSYYADRRKRLAEAHPGALFLFPSALVMQRNPDVTYPFRQESNFYYLSGFDEPESFLVIAPSAEGSGSHRSILFVQDRDPHKEMWEGERYGTSGAISVFGVDEAYSIRELDSVLPKFFSEAEKIFYSVGMDRQLDQKVFQLYQNYLRSLGRTGKATAPILDPKQVLGEMRLIKNSDEISILREACRISAEAHTAVMKEVRPGMNEFEVEALIDYGFRKQGCTRNGYGSIIAGGKNTTCLHYTANNEALKDGDLLLIDAGGEFEYYTADITRTFPVGRSFTDEQAIIYDLVLKAQTAAIEMVAPGVPYWDLHKKTTSVLVEGMIQHGFLTGDPEKIIQDQLHKRFYPHNTGHWLGIDVHDAGLYYKGGEPVVLEPGMVFTIEPGFYVQPTDTEVDPRWKDIGIRIEDNILVTENGYENLTETAPKERSDVEATRQGS